MRDELTTSLLDDPLRKAVNLPIGIDGSYYVGGSESKHDGVLSDSKHPRGQPYYYCDWEPTEDRCGIKWNEGEKFYEYVTWLKYIIDHFLTRWNYKVNGRVTWQGEEHGDIGTIIVKNNSVSTKKGHLVDDEDVSDSETADELADMLKTTKPINFTRYFKYVEDDVSDKFWNVQVSDKKVVVSYGKNGTKGNTLLKDFKSNAEAVKYAMTSIKEKLGKGYYEEKKKEEELDFDFDDADDMPTKKAQADEWNARMSATFTDAELDDRNSNGISTEMQQLVDALNSLLVDRSGEDAVSDKGKKYLGKTFNVWSKLIK